MNTITVELDTCDLAQAFKQAKGEVYNEIYSWDFMVNHVSTQLRVETIRDPSDELNDGHDRNQYVFTFQWFKT